MKRTLSVGSVGISMGRSPSIGGAILSGAVTRARSWPVSTVTMPGWRLAAPASIRRMRAWACGLRTKAACSMPGAVRSPT